MSAIKEHYHKEIEAGMRKTTGNPPHPKGHPSLEKEGKLEKPILFSTAMVKAISEGRKTMTRRVIKYSKKITNPKIGFSAFTDAGEFEVRGVHENGQYGGSFFKMPFVKGDLLWVRESFSIWLEAIKYKADGESVLKGFKYKPSIHMPKDYARIWLQVERVRVERLQDISEEDAVAEGVKYNTTFNKYECPVCDGKGHKGAGIDFLCEDGFYDSAKKAFQALWISLNGIESWHENPWIWVVEYKVLSTTGRPEEIKNEELKIKN